MVDVTRSEAAERCRCKPEELCPGPLAGIDESDKIRTIYDGSKGGANAHIEAHTGEKTTAPMVGDCLHAIHWLRTAADHPHLLRAPISGTEEKPRVHQPVQGQSPGAEGPERDPHSTSLPPRAEGPPAAGRLSVVDTLDRRAPFPPTPQARNALGGQVGTPDVAAADTGGNLHHPQGGCHQGPQAHKSAPEQVACIQNRWWVNRVGTYGMASAQLYWGRKASLVLRLLYYIFPQVALSLCGRLLLGPQMQQGGLGRHILATLLALGVPLSWKKTALSPINTWLGFVVDPITVCCWLQSSTS